MAAQLNQDFVTYQGDDPQPIFKVQDSSGNAVDISTVSEITWTARRDFDTAPALTKTKSGGAITFVNAGVDGQFQVAITKIDTAAMEGYYVHVAKIADAGGNVTTVTVGRLQVGLLPMWTYDPSQVPTQDVYAVRALVGDTIAGDQQLPDAVIAWAVTNYSNVWLAAAESARMISAQYARKVDTVQGELRILYGQQTKNYDLRARDLEQRGLLRGGGLPYAGGISVSDMQTRITDSDRVAPVFNLYWEDNRFPLGPAGQTESPGPGSEPGQSSEFPV